MKPMQLKHSRYTKPVAILNSLSSAAISKLTYTFPASYMSTAAENHGPNDLDSRCHLSLHVTSSEQRRAHVIYCGNTGSKTLQKYL